jgi:hypothetical protein
VVRIGLAKPRVRLIRIVAPELLMIDGLDLLTGLSTLAYLNSTTVLSGPISLRNPGQIPFQDWCRTPLMGYSPTGRRSITRLKGLRSEFREWRRRSCTSAARIQIGTAGDCRSD